MDKISYSFVKQKDSSLVFQSKVNSFNLDHVTDKDIVSFYTSFSKYSYFDTGLLPLDGTGLLGIRSAGDHTQAIYQYKPGLYHINWGAQENDNNYKNYYLAQPYRIVIIDFLNNNLLGARTFYALEPANHAGINLYHVNLPNINCKGYRGNGVGWICLYHNDDWSNLPFNERLIKALERCSGVEVYNDANMNETDGPRFYEEKKMSSYTFNPLIWEQKSSEEGWEWTLEPFNWIPILVKNRDAQGAHYEGGMQLTLLDAIAGNYQAYYHDAYIPKPINAISRPDLNITSKQITDWFVRSYNDSSTTFSGIDPYSDSSKIREQKSTNLVNTKKLAGHDLDDSEVPFDENEDDESQSMTVCPFTEESISSSVCIKNSSYMDDSGESINICDNCITSHDMVYAENTMHYYIQENWDEYLVFDSQKDLWYDTSAFKTEHAVCGSCGSVHISPYKDKSTFLIWTSHLDAMSELCSECISYSSLPAVEIGECSVCSINIPKTNSSYFNASQIAVHHDTVIICGICVNMFDDNANLLNKISKLHNSVLDEPGLAETISPALDAKSILALVSDLTDKLTKSKELLGLPLEDQNSFSEFLIPNAPINKEPF